MLCCVQTHLLGVLFEIQEHIFPFSHFVFYCSFLNYCSHDAAPRRAARSTLLSFTVHTHVAFAGSCCYLFHPILSDIHLLCIWAHSIYYNNLNEINFEAGIG